ncbi:hypothetical protein cyc_01256 [Cyclospora cayetanensis]|uniref:Uncharacterized protein n=1 Tax=Cyclospora cayetanensis TaxID=88456 RepID=A0A1D3CYW5_9EIME|nr:hypothetical protein cyc_01256 [Cyclospora cayetanensis]
MLAGGRGVCVCAIEGFFCMPLLSVISFVFCPLRHEPLHFSQRLVVSSNATFAGDPRVPLRTATLFVESSSQAGNTPDGEAEELSFAVAAATLAAEILKACCSSGEEEGCCVVRGTGAAFAAERLCCSLLNAAEQLTERARRALAAETGDPSDEGGISRSQQPVRRRLQAFLLLLWHCEQMFAGELEDAEACMQYLVEAVLFPVARKLDAVTPSKSSSESSSESSSKSSSESSSKMRALSEDACMFADACFPISCNSLVQAALLRCLGRLFMRTQQTRSIKSHRLLIAAIRCDG